MIQNRGATLVEVTIGVLISAIVGFGMNGRGAVEMVIAAVVLKLSDKLLADQKITEPLLTDDQFSALIVMAFITTIIAPLSLKWTLRKSSEHGGDIINSIKS